MAHLLTRGVSEYRPRVDVEADAMAKRRILLVHRDEQVRTELVQLFERQGHDARAAGHLVAAWADLSTGSAGVPDVILVAPATPGEQRFREALRKREPLAAVPVLELTGTMVEGLRDLARRPR